MNNSFLQDVDSKPLVYPDPPPTLRDVLPPIQGNLAFTHRSAASSVQFGTTQRRISRLTAAKALNPEYRDVSRGCCFASDRHLQDPLDSQARALLSQPIQHGDLSGQ